MYLERVNGRILHTLTKPSHAARAKALGVMVFDYKLDHHRIAAFPKVAIGIMMAIPAPFFKDIVPLWVWTPFMVIGLWLVVSGLQLMLRYELAAELQACPHSFTYLPDSTAYNQLIDEIARVSKREAPMTTAETVLDACFDTQGKMAKLLFHYLRSPNSNAEATATDLVIAFKAAANA